MVIDNCYVEVLEGELPEDEAAQLVQVDVADPGAVENFLSDPGVKASVDHMDGDSAARIRVPAVLLRDHRDII